MAASKEVMCSSTEFEKITTSPDDDAVQQASLL
jgi:hypothetical protein